MHPHDSNRRPQQTYHDLVRRAYGWANLRCIETGNPHKELYNV